MAAGRYAAWLYDGMQIDTVGTIAGGQPTTESLPDVVSARRSGCARTYAAPAGGERRPTNRSATASSPAVARRRTTISATWLSAAPVWVAALSATARADITLSRTALLAP